MSVEQLNDIIIGLGLIWLKCGSAKIPKCFNDQVNFNGLKCTVIAIYNSIYWLRILGVCLFFSHLFIPFLKVWIVKLIWDLIATNWMNNVSISQHFSWCIFNTFDTNCVAKCHTMQTLCFQNTLTLPIDRLNKQNNRDNKKTHSTFDTRQINQQTNRKRESTKKEHQQKQINK